MTDVASASTTARARSLSVRALGVTVAIDVSDDRLLGPLEKCWRAAAVNGHEATSEKAAGDLRVSAVGPSTDGPEAADELAGVLSQLTQEVTRTAIEARAGELLMFHAGALCDQATGATLAFIAPGGTGKTTLALTLGRRPDRGYVTDETVGVHLDGTVEPYCKPLSVRRAAPGPKDETSPLSLGLAVPAVSPWLAGMVLLRRDLAAGQPVVVEEVDALDALALLAPETSSLSRFDRPLHVLDALVCSVGGLRIVRYHDAVDLEPVVSAVLAQPRSAQVAQLSPQSSTVG
ncbi:MAG: hypothetical protein JWP82_715, partial [Humibacillus sp.]|nr:hypothetical protein [Humibacillus sp.]